MSSEVIKKRGRPKKVITELLDVVNVPEPIKKVSRAKSSTATPRTVKAKASTATKKAAPTKIDISKNAKTVVKPIASIVPLPAASPMPVPAKGASPLSPISSPTTPAASNVPIELEELETMVQDTVTATNAENRAESLTTSPILAQVQKLKERGKIMPAESIKQSSTANISSTKSSQTEPSPLKTSPPNIQNSPAPTVTKPAQCTPSTTPSKNPSPPPASKPSPPKPKLPLAALNSAIVSNISTRAGARPNTAGSKQLPQNYRSVSRKVTMTIVALPIMIVTSYVLYQRLVLGEERKLLVKVPPAAESPTSAASNAS